MEGWILNKKFQSECILDGFESFIWTDRYCEPGDFEIYMPIEKAPMEYIVRGNYVWLKDSDRLMIIEDIEITTDVEAGPHITITGRTLEALLDCRVIDAHYILEGDIQNAISKMLFTYAISPIDTERRVPFLQFRYNDDPRISKITLYGDYFGYELLDFITDVCKANDLGFKITYDEQELDYFVFEVYYGENRSYDQEKHPWVVFSPNYENLLDSNYYESIRNFRTFAIVAGDADNEYGQEIIRVNARPELIELDRREMFVDASDIDLPSDDVDEDAIRSSFAGIEGVTESTIANAIASAKRQEYLKNLPVYQEQLRQRGYEELAKMSIEESFEGEIEATRQYIYGRDFFIGDIVQIRDEYGKEASSRITEVIRSHDVSGEKITPTFTSVVKNKEEQ